MKESVRLQRLRKSQSDLVKREQERHSTLAYLALLKAETFRELNSANRFQVNEKDFESWAEEEKSVLAYYGKTEGDIAKMLQQGIADANSRKQKVLNEITLMQTRLEELVPTKSNDVSQQNRTFKARIVLIKVSLDTVRNQISAFHDNIHESLESWRRAIRSIIDAKRDDADLRLARARNRVANLQTTKSDLVSSRGQRLKARAFARVDELLVNPDNRVMDQFVNVTGEKALALQKRLPSIADITARLDELSRRISELTPRVQSIEQHAIEERVARNRESWVNFAAALGHRVRSRACVKGLQAEYDEALKHVPRGVELYPTIRQDLESELGSLREQIYDIGREMTQADLSHAETMRVLDEKLQDLLERTNT
jgi:hypothetical protein